MSTNTLTDASVIPGVSNDLLIVGGSALGLSLLTRSLAGALVPVGLAYMGMSPFNTVLGPYLPGYVSRDDLGGDSPGDPTDPTDPTEPVDPVDPGDPSNPVDPGPTRAQMLAVIGAEYPDGLNYATSGERLKVSISSSYDTFDPTRVLRFQIDGMSLTVREFAELVMSGVPWCIRNNGGALGLATVESMFYANFARTVSVAITWLSSGAGPVAPGADYIPIPDYVDAVTFTNITVNAGTMTAADAYISGTTLSSEYSKEEWPGDYMIIHMYNYTAAARASASVLGWGVTPWANRLSPREAVRRIITRGRVFTSAGPYLSAEALWGRFKRHYMTDDPYGWWLAGGLNTLPDDVDAMFNFDYSYQWTESTLPPGMEQP